MNCPYCGVELCQSGAVLWCNCGFEREIEVED